MGMTPRQLLWIVELPLALPVDRGRHPRRDRDRRRHGHHRCGHWRRRPRRVHLPRPLDGRSDGHSRGRDARRRCSRWSPTALLTWLERQLEPGGAGALRSRRLAAAAALVAGAAGHRRPLAARAPAARSSSDRRTSPSRSSSASSSRRRSSATEWPVDAPPESRRHVHLRSRHALGRHRRRTSNTPARRSPQSFVSRSVATLTRCSRPRASCTRAPASPCSTPLGFNNTFTILVRRDAARTHNLRTIGDLQSVAARLDARIRLRVHRT